jgi:hypothetical protein
MNCFLKICDELGVPIADENLVGPVHVLTFPGLEIDTDEMMVRIPQSKMNAFEPDFFSTSQCKKSGKLIKNITANTATHG